jgi:Ca2+/Na+ antiporter
MSTKIRNFVIITICLVFGIWLGFVYGGQFPGLSITIILLLACYVAWVLFSNNQGARITGPQLIDALEMNPLPGKARIYVMRTGFVGGQQGLNIKIGEQFSGQMRTNHFMMAEVNPGTYGIYAKLNAQTASTAITREITVNAGESVLLHYSMAVGLVQGSIIVEESRDKDVALKKLSKLKMVGWIAS